jgi:hypothetical protein
MKLYASGRSADDVQNAPDAAYVRFAVAGLEEHVDPVAIEPSADSTILIRRIFA